MTTDHDMPFAQMPSMSRPVAGDSEETPLHEFPDIIDIDLFQVPFTQLLFGSSLIFNAATFDEDGYIVIHMIHRF
jgi:hypothetical protein